MSSIGRANAIIVWPGDARAWRVPGEVRADVRRRGQQFADRPQLFLQPGT